LHVLWSNLKIRERALVNTFGFSFACALVKS
jgi:hypothetical protein